MNIDMYIRNQLIAIFLLGSAVQHVTFLDHVLQTSNAGNVTMAHDILMLQVFNK